MSLRWPVVAEAWAYGDPAEIVDRLIARTARSERRGGTIALPAVEHPQRDRFYTQARRLHVKQVMRGKQ